MKHDILNLDKKSVGAVELSEDVFKAQINAHVMAMVVNWQLACRRQGTHATKTVAEVSGTTKKPFRQKGTGSARAGSLRSPQRRGGGVIHGPVVRDHGYDLPKKVRKLGLKSAIASKFKEGKVIVLDTASKEPKTKIIAQKLKGLGLSSALFINGGDMDKNFILGAKGIIGMDILPTIGANVHDILRHDALVLTKDAVSQLEARVK